MITHIKNLFKEVKNKKKAIGAFNVTNLETIKAVVAAANKTKIPCIIEVTENAIKYAGLENLYNLIVQEVKQTRVPIALHLDHGHDFKLIKKCVQLGFSSVMIDASNKDFVQNIKETKRVVSYSKKFGVWVQAELGKLTAKKEFFTDPDDAVFFIEKTGVNTFAPAIGNYHGVQNLLTNKREKLEFTLLEKIAKMVDIPLVLHGVSDIRPNQVKKAVSLGVKVFNIDSAIRLAFTKGVKNYFKKNPQQQDPRKYLLAGQLAAEKEIIKKMSLFYKG